MIYSNPGSTLSIDDKAKLYTWPENKYEVSCKSMRAIEQDYLSDHFNISVRRCREVLVTMFYPSLPTS